MRCGFFFILFTLPVLALDLTLIPRSVSQGQVTLVRAAVKAPTDLPESFSVSLGEQTARVWDCGAVQKCALIAIPFDAQPGKFQLKVEWKRAGIAERKELVVEVRKGKFRVDRLKVDPKLTSPSVEEQARMDRERAEITSAYASGDPFPLWKKGFAMPTSTAITSHFGNNRTFNGQVESVHFGVDLRANVETRVRAANDGRVLLAKNFFLAGNMVLLDHGAGLFSSYSHLSTLAVTTGQIVTRGTKLGMAGATGRVTAPHLHWGVRVNGIPVDPHQLVSTINKTQ